MAGEVSVRWTGTEAVIEEISKITRRLRDRHLKYGIDKGARVVSAAMKSTLKRNRTGMLRRAIGVKVKQRPNGFTYAKIGARRDVMGNVTGRSKTGVIRAKKLTAKAVKGGATGKIKPSRYAHFIEKGHAGKSAAPAYPFMSPAVAATRHTVMAIIEAELTKAIETG